jgi:hypothetical protein
VPHGFPLTTKSGKEMIRTSISTLVLFGSMLLISRVMQTGCADESSHEAAPSGLMLLPPQNGKQADKAVEPRVADVSRQQPDVVKMRPLPPVAPTPSEDDQSPSARRETPLSPAIEAPEPTPPAPLEPPAANEMAIAIEPPRTRPASPAPVFELSTQVRALRANI